MVDGTDKHAGMDGDRRKRAAAAKKGKKDELDNLKKEVEMVTFHQRFCVQIFTSNTKSIVIIEIKKYAF